MTNTAPLVLQSELLKAIPGIVHAFGTIHEPLPTSIIPSWMDSAPIWNQVHKTDTVEISQKRQPCGDIDGMWSRTAGLPVGARSADCVPILMARPGTRGINGKASSPAWVAAVHAGWRGTRARILQALWETLRARGENPADWTGVVGPAIGSCCYEVSEEIAADFRQTFGAYAVPRPRYLDLQDVNLHELQNLGFGQSEILPYCTRCSLSPLEPENHYFHSFRREGGNTRQFAVAMSL